ncbi:hypothetical protein D557_0426 [Bordetella holmesii 70147]|nr:hypothetical protein D558_1171 [Bordetella holmesii 44057]EWM50581.1 hypothetical protein D557_0426 [Bordetella holmesii 70147]
MQGRRIFTLSRSANKCVCILGISSSGAATGILAAQMNSYFDLWKIYFSGKESNYAPA